MKLITLLRGNVLSSSSEFFRSISPESSRLPAEDVTLVPLLFLFRFGQYLHKLIFGKYVVIGLGMATIGWVTIRCPALTVTNQGRVTRAC